MGREDWHKVLSLTEQQLLALANILLSGPRFVVLDRVEMTLGSNSSRGTAPYSPRCDNLININIGKTEIDA